MNVMTVGVCTLKPAHLEHQPLSKHNNGKYFARINTHLSLH